MSTTNGDSGIIYSSRIYAGFDSKAAAFLQPFFAKNDAVAIRFFQAACGDPEHFFCRNPEDYTLWRIGEWSEDSGELVGTVPMQIARAMDYATASPPGPSLSGAVARLAEGVEDAADEPPEGMPRLVTPLVPQG